MSDGADAIVVCGGGVIGCACAYYLTQLGQRVIVIERASDVGQFASGRAGGFLARDWSDELSRVSFDMFAALSDDFKAEIDYRPVDALSVNVVGPAADEQDSSTTASWMRSSCSVDAVIGTTKDSAQCHPQKLTRALLRRAVGAQLIRNASVTRLSKNGVVYETMTDNVKTEVELRAKTVVLALGPWSSFAASWLPALAPLRRVVPQKAHSIIVRPQDSDKIPAQCLFLGGFVGKMESPEIYPRPDGTVYVCAGVPEEAELNDSAEEIPTCDEAVDGMKIVLRDVSTHLADAAEETRQACFLPSSQRPIISKVATTNDIETTVIVATGHSVWGILRSLATGKAVAHLAVNGESAEVNLKSYRI